MATPPLHKTRRKKGFEGKHGERSKGAKPGQARQRHFTHHNGSSHGNPVCGSPDPPTYNPRFHSLLWLSRRGGGVGSTSAVLHTKLLSWDCVGSILGFSSCLSGYYFWLSGPSVSPPFFWTRLPDICIKPLDSRLLEDRRTIFCPYICTVIIQSVIFYLYASNAHHFNLLFVCFFPSSTFS